MIYGIAWVIWKILRTLSFPVKVQGKENVPAKGVCIFASNHLSYLDPMIIGERFPRYISYMAKDSLFKNKVFAFFLNGVGAFPVKRESSDIGAIKEALKRLRAGSPLVLFPEGTRLTSQKEIHPGIALIAVKSGVPVVPVYLQGSDHVLAPGAQFLKRHPVSVSFGPSKIYSKEISYDEIADQIMKEIYLMKHLKNIGGKVL